MYFRGHNISRNANYITVIQLYRSRMSFFPVLIHQLRGNAAELIRFSPSPSPTGNKRFFTFFPFYIQSINVLRYVVMFCYSDSTFNKSQKTQHTNNRLNIFSVLLRLVLRLGLVTVSFSITVAKIEAFLIQNPNYVFRGII